MSPEHSPDLVKEFASDIIRNVRDRAVRNCDMLVVRKSTSMIGERWDMALKNATAREALTTLLPDIVDETIFALLDAIDNGVLRLTYASSAGDSIDLTDSALGEMAGWFMGNDGWRNHYCQERFFDDSRNFTIDFDLDSD
jgi:hypothetical protein